MMKEISEGKAPKTLDITMSKSIHGELETTKPSGMTTKLKTELVCRFRPDIVFNITRRYC